MIRILLLCAALAAPLLASSTASWEMNNYADFVRGRFTGLSLSRDGRMALSPTLDTLFSSEQPVIWAIAPAPDGSYYLATGHKGRLYRVLPNGKSELVWTAQEPEIFALAVGRGGEIFAATSPGGKVYRIVGGKATEYFDPAATYIWSLATARDGSLFVGTGDEGKIYRVTGPGQSEVYYETGQNHVTALLAEASGNLLVGTEPNGILYRVSAKDKAFVLYDANLPEIRAVAIAPDGSIYAAALGGSLAQKVNAAGAAATTSTAPVVVPTTTITVTDQAQAGVEIKPPGTDPNKAAAIAPGTVVYTAAEDTTAAGVERSALYKVNPDHTVETLWSSKDENIYDVALLGSAVMFSTDSNGRIYRLSPDRRTTLVLETNEGETVRLTPAGTDLLAATGTMGKLMKLGQKLSPAGLYESPVHDAGTVARWGQISWRGERRGDSVLTFRTRSGNSARPDRTWSDWSDPLAEPAGSNIGSPNARFIQWRAEFKRGDTESPSLTGVTLAYLPQNNPPIVRALNVTTVLAPATSSSRSSSAAQAAAATYSVTVTDTGEAAASTLSGTPSQNLPRGVSQQIQLTWQAEDPDGDRLVYALYFRGEGETNWKLLRTNFSETSLTLEGDVLADGKYFFRVVASDKSANVAASAREGELISAPVLFDNTPPQLTAGTPRRNAATAEIDVEGFDAASGLRRAEYSVDAAAWVPIEAADGVTDGHRERFQIRLRDLTPGEHLVVIRAVDSANNAGLTKVLLP